MTAVKDSSDRDVIPRWRPFRATVRAGELSTPQQSDYAMPRPNLREHIEAFQRFPGFFAASDLVSSASVSGGWAPEVEQAVELILDSDEAPLSARDLAASLRRDSSHQPDRPMDLDDSPPETKKIGLRIHQIRSILHKEPRNAVRWIDLALCRVLLGAQMTARREIETALSLAPDNRFVLRAASSFFIHVDDAERAGTILSRAAALTSDPWILSADLAVAEVLGKSSRHQRRAAQLVLDGDDSPWHLSELASELATAELRHGRDKVAKRLMDLALRDPTENAMAQAEWAADKGLSLIDQIDLQRPFAFEARARSNVRGRRWNEAVRWGKQWQADQAFSVRSAAFTSYFAAVGAADFEAGREAAASGLRSNPGNPLLVNNLAFSLANLGRPEEAREQLIGLETASDKRLDAIVAATRGLISFRLGDSARGKLLYGKAIHAFRELEQSDLIALAQIFLAREQMRAQTLDRSDSFKIAEETAARSSSPEVAAWRERLWNELITSRLLA